MPRRLVESCDQTAPEANADLAASFEADHHDRFAAHALYDDEARRNMFRHLAVANA